MNLIQHYDICMYILVCVEFFNFLLRQVLLRACHLNEYLYFLGQGTIALYNEVISQVFSADDGCCPDHPFAVWVF